MKTNLEDLVLTCLAVALVMADMVFVGVLAAPIANRLGLALELINLVGLLVLSLTAFTIVYRIPRGWYLKRPRYAVEKLSAKLRLNRKALLV